MLIFKTCLYSIALGLFIALALGVYGYAAQGLAFDAKAAMIEFVAMALCLVGAQILSEEMHYDA